MKETGCARPISLVMYQFGYDCFITCHHQSRWEYQISDDMVELINERRGIRFYIKLEEFNRNWKIVSREGKW